MSRAFAKIFLIALISLSQSQAAIGEWYIKGEVTKITKTSVVISVEHSKDKIAIPKDMIKPELAKIGAKIIRNVTEEELIKMASIKSGGGSK
ncbi:MAG: hypothetical protein Fur0010_26880 [Bdellovibrio sp.]